MRNLFRGYYKLTTPDIKKIWKDGFISFDANVLLNLYRYSPETSTEFLNTIKKIQNKIWIPHQAAQEFHQNRIVVIAEQLKVYDDTIKKFNAIEGELKTKYRHPYLSPNLLQKTELNFSQCKKDLLLSKKKYFELLKNDSILTKLTAILDKRVGSPYTKEELDKLFKKGEERYKTDQPPGFKDKGKDGNRKYGDFIIWSQLVAKSKELKKSFILVSDDRKEDWWLQTTGQTISPRPELLQELFLESGAKFHMYQPDRFINYISKTKINKVKKRTIDEVRDFQNEKPNYFTSSYYDPNGINSILNSDHQTFLDSLNKKTNQFLFPTGDSSKNLGYGQPKPFNYLDLANLGYFDTPKSPDINSNLSIVTASKEKNNQE